MINILKWFSGKKETGIQNNANPNWFVQGGDSPFRVNSGEIVNPDTARTLSAVYRSVALISTTIGYLTWGVYKDNQVQRNHRLYNMLHTRVSPEMSAGCFKETMTSDALYHGNGFAEIEFDKVGRPVHLWRIPPWLIEVVRDKEAILGVKDAICYLYTPQDTPTQRVLLPASKIFHLKGLGDGLVGQSVVSLAARSIGMSLASENFASFLYVNRATPSGTLETEQTLSNEAFDLLKEQFKKEYTGSTNAGKTIILEQGLKYKPMSMSPADIQFLESRKFQVEDIARWFGVPPHKLGDLSRATFSNIEHQGQEFVNDTILPWTKRFEEEANYKLLTGGRDGYYTKINLNALMRGDALTRSKYYSSGILSGYLTVNEVRALEDLPPVEGGDDLRQQMQMQSITNPQKEDNKENEE